MTPIKTATEAVPIIILVTISEDTTVAVVSVLLDDMVFTNIGSTFPTGAVALVLLDDMLFMNIGSTFPTGAVVLVLLDDMLFMNIGSTFLLYDILPCSDISKFYSLCD